MADKQGEYSETEIINRIFIVRNQKVMLDRDLAEMYGVPTFRLNEAVKRNINRFPEDFMVQLTANEFNNLISQNAISSWAYVKPGWGGIRKLPFAFTEHGVAMLSSVLRSERAVQVNIGIMRAYIKMKQILVESKELWQKIEAIEQNLVKKDDEIKSIFKILKELLLREAKPKTIIGFKIPNQH